MNGLQQNAAYLDFYSKTQVRKLLFQTEVDHTAITEFNHFTIE